MPDVLPFQGDVNNLFARVRFILDQTSHPGNVGACARALKTMGFKDLVLIKPRNDDVLSLNEARVRSAGGLDILNNARIADNFYDAVDGVCYCVGLSARRRGFDNIYLHPRDAVFLVINRLIHSEGKSIAFIFGNEQHGLSNEILSKCQEQWCIPSNLAYSALNLAAAVQIVAYEIRIALLQNTANNLQIYEKKSSRFSSSIGSISNNKKSLADSDDLIFLLNRLSALMKRIGFSYSLESQRGWLHLCQSFMTARFTKENIFFLHGVLKKMEKILSDLS